VEKAKRRIVEGWVDTAANQLQAAKSHLNSYMQFAECIQAAQQCIELSLKSILLLLGVDYGSSHGLDQPQFSKLAKQIQDSDLVDRLAAQNLAHIRLPRLLLLANLWAHFYQPAKYGLQSGYLAPAKDLFDREEATLALRHAEECYSAAIQVKCLDETQLTTLNSVDRGL